LPTVRVTNESGLSYLWDALLLSSYSQFDEPSTWVSEYGGRTDRHVRGLLGNMHNRQGAVFDLRDAIVLDDVVRH
jgi:hypothetical protein